MDVWESKWEKNFRESLEGVVYKWVEEEKN